MGLPPVAVGAAQVTVALASPAVAATSVGALGVTAKVCCTVGAAAYAALPAWLALTVQSPKVPKLSTLPAPKVQTPVAMNVTVRPDVALADSVGVAPKTWLPGLAKLMVCAPWGFTALLGADVVVCEPLLAVTVKV